MHDVLRLSGALILVAAVGATATAKTSRFVLSLDAPDQQMPEYLCVVSDNYSCKGKDDDDKHELACDTRKLETLRAKGVFGGKPIATAKDVTALALGSPKTAALQDLKAHMLYLALDRLTTGRGVCSATNDICTPALNLSTFFDEAKQKFTGRVVCGSNFNQSGRVAFVGIKFGSVPDGGISEVQFAGSTATIVSRDENLTKHDFSIQVIGGDYVPSDQTLASKDIDTTKLLLQPRCFPLTVPLPPRGSLAIKTIDFTRGDAKPSPACIPEVNDDSTVTLQVPVASDPVKTRLDVKLDDGSELAAQWSSRIPPPQITPGIKTLNFHWRPDCLSGGWTTPDGKPDESPSARWRWNARCPQATVTSSDTVCELVGPTGEPVPPSSQSGDCDYRCTASAGDRLFSLPLEVRFDRYRTSEEESQSNETVVYSWRDTVHVVGEQLDSFVPPPDRRLVVNFSRPESWTDNHGETFDEIQIVLPGGQVDHIDLPHDNKPAPRWAAVYAPNLVCRDIVRVAVFGGKQYSERPFSANGGALVLDRPYTNQPRWHAWLIAGGGVLAPLDANGKGIDVPRMFDSYALVGAGAERYFEDEATTLELDGLFELGTTPFGRLTQGDPEVHELGYEHVVGRVTVERWHWPRVHFGGSIGGALGIPLLNSNQGRLGSLKLSEQVELNGRVRLKPTGSVWLEAAIGLRLNEGHEFFETDFTGAPHAVTRRLFQPYLAFRVRVRLG